MKINFWFLVVLSLFLVGSSKVAVTREAGPGFIYRQLEDLQFEPVPGLSGVSFAVLAGNPAEPGTYVIRARFAAGVTTPPHYHDQVRHVTVISGVWYFGTDDSGDCGRTMPLKTGAYAMHPKGAVHFDGSCNNETTEVQITGIGPVNTHWLSAGS